MGFKHWLENLEGESVRAELEQFFGQIKQHVLRSFRPSSGYASFSFPDYSSLSRPLMRLAASTFSPGALAEAKSGGWGKEGGKGQVALGKLGSTLAWNPQQRTMFQKAMDAPKGRSLPATVGREMGLLFELEAFIYLVQSRGLKPITGKDLAFAQTEQQKLQAGLVAKLGQDLTDLVMEFVQVHAAGPPHSMGEMMYQKTLQLIGKGCNVDAIEFMGGHGGTSYDPLRGDTADIRIGCEQFMPGQRSDVGYSLKAGTEPEMQIRSLTLGKTVRLFGGDNWKLAARRIKALFSNPLLDDKERRSEVMQILLDLARKRFNTPGKFVRLLELLLTGGADTLPAARQMVRNLGGPGWSRAFQMCFATSEEPGRKLGPKAGATLTVDANQTYISLAYIVREPKANCRTTLKFEPEYQLTGFRSGVDVSVNNLTALGGRGY